jgi:two-component system sensor kinase FixL
MQRTQPGRGRSESKDRSAYLEAQWAALQTATVDAVLVFDEQGRIESCNQAAERIFGYSPGELLGREIRLLLPADWLPPHPAGSTGPDGGELGPVRREELAGRRKDGSTFPLRVAVGELVAGDRRGFVGIAHDISLLKRAEANLRQREEFLTLTIRHAPTGIATVDLEGRFLSVNRAFCSMVGYSEEELVGRAVNSITHPDDVEYADRRLRELRQGRLTEYETRKRYIRKDGAVVEGLMSACLVHDSDGKPLMYVGQVEDLTDRLRAEREAKESQDRLAHVTRLNTLGEMAAGIAHEINQPLAAIATYAHASRRMLQAGPADAERFVTVLDKIATQAERAGDVIRRLREFVRQRSSARELVRVDKLIGDITQLAEVDARTHDLTIRVDVAAELAPVFADPVQVQQVVLNLIRNAIDAMETPDITSRAIDIRGGMSGEDFVVISVVDRGTGISDEVERQLFKTFFTTKESGLGMGLAISRSIIESHGGRLWFTRNEDGGTAFHLTLPTTEGTDDDEG